MPLWNLRCYVSSRGVDEIRAWYDGMKPAVRAKFDSRIKFLVQRTRSDWKRPLFDLLGDDGKGLGEVRFEVGNVQYRPLGFFSPNMTFTLVFCAEERDGEFVPKDATKIALRRRQEIEDDQERSRECDFELE